MDAQSSPGAAPSRSPTGAAATAEQLRAYDPAALLESILAGMTKRPVQPLPEAARALRLRRAEPLQALRARAVLSGWGSADKAGWAVEAAAVNGKGRFTATAAPLPPLPRDLQCHGYVEPPGGVEEAVESVKTLAAAAAAQAVELGGGQEAVDAALLGADGTRNGERIGAAALFACSVACARAQAAPLQPLLPHYPCEDPDPLWLYLWRLPASSPQGAAGAVRAGKAPAQQPPQEPPREGFPATLPVPCATMLEAGPSTSSPCRCDQICVACWGAGSAAACMAGLHAVREALREDLPTPERKRVCGPRGADVTPCADVGAALQLVAQAIAKARKRGTLSPCAELRVLASMDAARLATVSGKAYDLTVGEKSQMTSEELLAQYTAWSRSGLLHGVIDPFEPSDAAWPQLRQRCPGLLVLGHCIVQANGEQLQACIRRDAIGGVAAHPRDAATVSGWLWLCAQAAERGACVAAFAGEAETDDAAPMHCAIAAEAQLAALGGLEGSEHTAQWNELLRADDWLRERGRRARWAPPAAWAHDPRGAQ
eukprot:TRINITY_DN334_c0_g6_i1.p2 TRINITY_DN334_c0_g6~~TRINITY_DN334_c0_g6_i1.p2  ORF type:complete len:542 (+),score=152.62 TRINITY_DN334_c0_g6_i1:90-1715(+)